jgi:hypothetical protein
MENAFPILARIETKSTWRRAEAAAPSVHMGRGGVVHGPCQRIWKVAIRVANCVPSLIVFWRLTVLAENLDLEIENSEPIRLTHGAITVVLDASAAGARIIAEIATDTPEGVYKRLRGRAESGDSYDTPPGASLSPELLAWLAGRHDVLPFAAEVKHRLEYAAFRLLQLLGWIGALVLVSQPRNGELSWSLDGDTSHAPPPTDKAFEADIVLDEPLTNALQACSERCFDRPAKTVSVVGSGGALPQLATVTPRMRRRVRKAMISS